VVVCSADGKSLVRAWMGGRWCGFVGGGGLVEFLKLLVGLARSENDGKQSAMAHREDGGGDGVCLSVWASDIGLRMAARQEGIVAQLCPNLDGNGNP
jgi:hypothetical protein